MHGAKRRAADIGNIGKPSDNARRPESPVPPGLREMRRWRRRAPRHRRPSYDLRRPSSHHPHFATNALHRRLVQRFPTTLSGHDARCRHRFAARARPSRNDLASPSFRGVRQPGATTGAVARRAGLGSGNLLAYAKRPGTGSPILCVAPDVELARRVTARLASRAPPRQRIPESTAADLFSEALIIAALHRTSPWLTASPGS